MADAQEEAIVLEDGRVGVDIEVGAVVDAVARLEPTDERGIPVGDRLGVRVRIVRIGGRECEVASGAASRTQQSQDAVRRPSDVKRTASGEVVGVKGEERDLVEYGRVHPRVSGAQDK